IKSTTPMFNPNGQVHRQIPAGAAVRVYGYDKGKYDVGGGYYVLESSTSQYMVGVLTAQKEVSILNQQGKVVGTLKKGQKINVEKLDVDKAYINSTSSYIKHDRVNTVYAKS